MESSRLVLALPTIGTGRASTLIHVLLTAGACESWGAGSGRERRMRYTEVNLSGFPEDTPRAGEHGVTGGRYGKGSCVMQGQLSSLSGLQPSC